MTTTPKIAVTAALVLSGFGATAGGAAATPADAASAYSVNVERNQPRALNGRSVQMSARLTSHQAQTINSYVIVQTHPHSWLGSSPDSTDFAAGESRTIRYSAHHAGIRRA